jgi:endoglycosylceramidase
MDEYGNRKDESGLPLIEDCTKHKFFMYYTSPEVASGFDAFYKNENNVLDKFMLFWDYISKRFANDPNVIGFDILNEPFSANIYHKAMLFFQPQKFVREILYPITKNFTERILANAPDKIVFFEPS